VDIIIAFVGIGLFRSDLEVAASILKLGALGRCNRLYCTLPVSDGAITRCTIRAGLAV
jgi:hypothetical protein